MMTIVRTLVWSLIALAVAALWWAQRPSAPPVAEWARVLAEHVDGAGWVDYARLATTGRPALDAVLAKLARVDEGALGRPERRLAFWIDAHNAIMLKAVSRRYPVDTVLGLDGFHSEPAYVLAGQRVSLDVIEHRILRQLLDEPRVALALFRANWSSPGPRREPYLAGDLGQALDAQERAFLADPERNRFEPEAGLIKVSGIYSHLAHRFEARGGSLAAHLAVVAPAAARPMLARPDALVEYLSEDHTLDEKPGTRPVPLVPLLRSPAAAGSSTDRRVLK